MLIYDANFLFCNNLNDREDLKRTPIKTLKHVISSFYILRIPNRPVPFRRVLTQLLELWRRGDCVRMRNSKIVEIIIFWRLLLWSHNFKTLLYVCSTSSHEVRCKHWSNKVKCQSFQCWRTLKFVREQKKNLPFAQWSIMDQKCALNIGNAIS